MPIFDIEAYGESQNALDTGFIFLLTNDELETEGIHIPYSGEVITKKSEDGVDTYTFKPSNIELNFDPDNTMLGIVIGNFSVTLTFNDIGDDIGEGSPLAGTLKKILRKLMIKQTGREISAVENIGRSRGLSHNVEGRLAEFVSGEKGHTVTQKNRLRQKLGVHLAPRARNTRKNRNK